MPADGRCAAAAHRPVRTLLVDNYDSYTYNLYQLLAVVNGVPPTVIYNDQVAWPALRARLAAREWDNVVISPGPGTPAVPGDVGVCLDLLRWAAGVGGGDGDGGDPPPTPPLPVLGVCLGMQALALALGGRVHRADAPVHGRLSAVRHSGCPLFEGIPSAVGEDAAAGSGLEVVRYHSLVVDEASLPACLVPTAWTVGGTHAVAKEGEPAASTSPARPATAGASAPLDGGRPVLMAIRHAHLPLYGVQFHPESVATTHGARLCANFRDLTLAGLGAPGGPPVPAWASSADAAVAALLEGGHAEVGTSSPPASPPLPEAAASTTTLVTARLPGAATALGPRAGETLFFSLFGARHATADTFWLDSSSAPDRGRFSYMGGPGGKRWLRVSYRLGGGLTSSAAAAPPTTTTTPDALWTALATGLADAALDAAGLTAAAALPFAFTGGWVGYLGYELRAECGVAAGGSGAGSTTTTHSPQPPRSSLPDAAFFFADRLVAVDHAAGDVYVLALADVGEDGKGGDARAWVEATTAAVAGLAADAAGAAAAAAPPSPPLTPSTPPPPFTVRRGRATYLADVEACRAALAAGDSYELCLTTALTRSPAALPDPAALYRALRRVNPAPYAAFLDFQGIVEEGGTAGPTLCCSSPERFLRGGSDGGLEARPIKGTARRVHDDPAADAAAAAALAASEKDRAENLMIVDLLRNDLGRVCGTGSVRVPGLMDVESFATVHQLVSTVVGRRAPGVTALAAVRAAFPGGSMTGAPKARSMDILDGLEGAARGPYSGAIGWFSVLPGTPFDLNIVIRTAIVDRAADALTIGAGGAVVIQSTPEGEYDEMRLKAAALLRAVGEVDGGGKGGGGGGAVEPAAVVDE